MLNIDPKLMRDALLLGMMGKQWGSTPVERNMEQPLMQVPTSPEASAPAAPILEGLLGR